MTQKETGHFVCYVPKKFSEEGLNAIEQANSIIAEYEGAGMPLTLRQLYYQHVARGFIPNNVREYNKLGNLINDGRMAGLVSWTAIEDRGRNLMGLRNQSSPAGAIKSALPDYRIDLWAEQRFRPEVWVEKHALEGVIGSICNALRVDYFGVGGYNSQSNAWRAGRRMARYISKGQTPIVFHLGDHDPSGIDMTRDNQERLSLFCGHPVQVIRLALNRPQIDQYNPPPNPAKVTDPRANAYIAKHGDESWELDALRPEVIRDLIKDAVLKLRDEKLWDEALKQEAADKMELQDIIDEIGDSDEEENDED